MSGTIVQSEKSSYIACSTTNNTVTMGSAPTAANLLVFIGVSLSFGAGTIVQAPAGFTTLRTITAPNYNSSNITYITIAIRTVQTGDGAGWTFTLPAAGASNYGWGACLYEVTGVGDTFIADTEYAQSPDSGVNFANISMADLAGDMLITAAANFSPVDPSGIAYQITQSGAGWTKDFRFSSGTLYGDMDVWHQGSIGAGAATSNVTATFVNQSNEQIALAIVRCTQASSPPPPAGVGPAHILVSC